VPPLSPQKGTELFLTRARATDPGFSPSVGVEELCKRLDNLPLAIELAAARVRVLSPKQLLERLSKRLDLLRAGRGVDPRQKTLRATIEWSYELLEPDEQHLFAHLSIFRGGCTLEAAEEVCDADVDILQSLVDKSLVRHNEGRFWILETIRELASERLAESGEASKLRRRHADYFVALATAAEPHLETPESAHWFKELDREVDNIRAAIDTLEDAELEGALALVGALQEFWVDRGLLGEAERRIARLLRRAEYGPSTGRVRALIARAAIAYELGNLERARTYGEEARGLARALPGGDVRLNALASELYGVTTSGLGALRAQEGEMEESRTLYGEAAEACAESIPLYESLGLELNKRNAMMNVAWATFNAGDHAHALELYERVLTEARGSGSFLEAWALHAFSKLSVLPDGDVDRALQMLKESAQILHRIGNQQYLAYALSSVAYVLARASRAAEALPILGSVLTYFEDVGISARPWFHEDKAETLERCRAILGDDQLQRLLDEGRSLTLDDAAAYAATVPV
jgi:tetratricopeptide (TPR) repeat protein